MFDIYSDPTEIVDLGRPANEDFLTDTQVDALDRQMLELDRDVGRRSEDFLLNPQIDALDRQMLELDRDVGKADPYGSLYYAPPAIGYVGKSFSSRMAGDEREVDEREVAPAVTTEERAEPREVTIKGVKGNAPSSVTSATPGYDISTYGIDPYETISGAVQTGRDTTGRDGTPYGGGDDTRRPLTAEEIQYLSDMGYFNGGGGSSAATVNPSVAPIRYDISKFISGIGSLANSGNRT